MNEKSQISFNKSRKAFDKFVNENADKPEFKGKFVVFVHGKYEAIGDDRNDLIENVYDKYGNVPMYASEITKERRIIHIR